jgi:hypothetical protein
MQVQNVLKSYKTTIDITSLGSHRPYKCLEVLQKKLNLEIFWNPTAFFVYHESISSQILCNVRLATIFQYIRDFLSRSFIFLCLNTQRIEFRNKKYKINAIVHLVQTYMLELPVERLKRVNKLIQI